MILKSSHFKPTEAASRCSSGMSSWGRDDSLQSTDE